MEWWRSKQIATRWAAVIEGELNTHKIIIIRHDRALLVKVLMKTILGHFSANLARK